MRNLNLEYYSVSNNSIPKNTQIQFFCISVFVTVIANWKENKKVTFHVAWWWWRCCILTCLVFQYIFLKCFRRRRHYVNSRMYFYGKTDKKMGTVFFTRTIQQCAHNTQHLEYFCLLKALHILIYFSYIFASNYIKTFWNIDTFHVSYSYCALYYNTTWTFILQLHFRIVIVETY